MADVFDTLGLEPTFALTKEILDARQRELSRALHPDRYAGALPAERRHALSEAINVNEAHRALRDPLRRAEVLLARLGLQEPKTQPDQAFLFEVMELREALSGAARAKDMAAVRALAQDFERRRQQAEEQLATHFDALLPAPNRTPLTSAATAPSAPATAPSAPATAPSAPATAERAATVGSLFTTLAALRYYRRFLDEVANIEDELDV